MDILEEAQPPTLTSSKLLAENYQLTRRFRLIHFLRTSLKARSLLMIGMSSYTCPWLARNLVKNLSWEVVKCPLLC